MEGTDGRAAGLYLPEADGERADAIPNAAGGEGGHEAARPEGVIHRNLLTKKV
jgi:hypothetical protein